MGSERLLFENFSAYEVVVPARKEVFACAARDAPHALSSSWPDLPITLIEGKTNFGVVALGEAPRGLAKESISAHLHGLLHKDLATWHPMNSDLSNFGELGLKTFYPLRANQGSQAEFAMLDESLWLDAVGQRAGLPAHAFLGGKVHNHVPVDAWANRPNASQLSALIESAVAAGFTGIKLKCSQSGDTLKAIQEIADDLPSDFRFTVDAMYALRTWREGHSILAPLSPLADRLTLEDPFDTARVDDWHQCRSRLPFPLICHPRTAKALHHAITNSLADAMNLRGSAFEFQYLSQICEFHYLDCWHGSSLELGVAQTLRLHSSSTARSCVLPCDLQSAWVRESLLITPTWQYEAGRCVVPDLPGLGIDLDHDEIRRYLVQEWQVT